MAPSSEVVEHGSATSTVRNSPTPGNSPAPTTASALTHLLGQLNHTRAVPWLQDSWLVRNIRHERIALGSPRVTVAMLGHGLVQHHTNLSPTLRNAGDFVLMFDSRGRLLGARPKLATWPLLKADIVKFKDWPA